jgi:hypothetical protein
MKKASRKTKTFSITVPTALLPVIKWGALETHRNVSSYLSWLIALDLEKKS